ncbi:hypothetical protein E2C01_047309 [Portunus trituberculatus]|uniref:Uncharacterized protein n=1 Tax=Portunus trituberculatus TaxID=210409 RepID=A0A5B7G743_PORTR|nr:hypothetical protein [Portunus trituberculatus]
MERWLARGFALGRKYCAPGTRPAGFRVAVKCRCPQGRQLLLMSLSRHTHRTHRDFGSVLVRVQYR